MAVLSCFLVAVAAGLYMGIVNSNAGRAGTPLSSGTKVGSVWFVALSSWLIALYLAVPDAINLPSVACWEVFSIFMSIVFALITYRHFARARVPQ